MRPRPRSNAHPRAQPSLPSRSAPRPNKPPRANRCKARLEHRPLASGPPDGAFLPAAASPSAGLVLLSQPLLPGSREAFVARSSTRHPDVHPGAPELVSVSPTSSLTTTTAPAGPKARSEPGLLRGFRPGRWGRRRPERSLCLLPCPSSPPSASRLINLCPMPPSVSWLQSVTHPSEGTFGGSACARAHVPGRGTLSLADPVSGRAKGSGVQLPSPEAPARLAAVAGKQQTKRTPVTRA